MIENNRSTKSESDNNPGSRSPVRVGDAAPTPKAEAKVANKLPRREQLNKFEQDLAAHDSGNQPA